MSGAIDVYARSSGRSDAPMVVLAHPIGTSSTVWDPQLLALEDHFHVVRYDARGHGASPVPAGPYSMEELGDDLAAVIRRFGGGPASIVGQSLGGMTALWVAEHAPELVDRVVACCVSARAPSPQPWFERAAMVRAGGTAAIHDLVLQRWGYTERRTDLAAWILEELDRTPPEGYAGACEALAGMDLEPRLGEIQAATLIVAGELDPAAPRARGEAIAAAIPNARAVTVPGAAHLLNRERSEALNDLILEHLGATPKEVETTRDR